MANIISVMIEFVKREQYDEFMKKYYSNTELFNKICPMPSDMDFFNKYISNRTVLPIYGVEKSLEKETDDDAFNPDVVTKAFNNIIKRNNENEDIYDWRLKNWGASKEAEGVDFDDEKMRVLFDSVWSYPESILEKLAKEFDFFFYALEEDNTVCAAGKGKDGELYIDSIEAVNRHSEQELKEIMGFWAEDEDDDNEDI